MLVSGVYLPSTRFNDFSCKRVQVETFGVAAYAEVVSQNEANGTVTASSSHIPFAVKPSTLNCFLTVDFLVIF